MNRLIVGAALLVAGWGCAPAPDPHPPTPDTGTVTLDGLPLKEGEIGFFPQDGSGPRLGPIKDGKFRLDAPAGQNRVEIQSYRVTKLPVPDISGATEMKTNLLPPCYSQESALTADVRPGAANELKFELKSKP